MANIIKDFLGYLKLGEDDEFDEFLDEVEEEPERKSKKRDNSRADHTEARPERESRPERDIKSERSFLSGANSSARRYTEEAAEQPKERKSTRTERTTSNKIVPIRTTPKGLEVCIMKPSSFEDSQDICDMLLTGRAVVVNLEGFDPLDAQRIMDFISGSVYAINGKLHQISKYIFIFSPDTIDISGDNLGFIADDSFEVPTLNKEF